VPSSSKVEPPPGCVPPDLVVPRLGVSVILSIMSRLLTNFPVESPAKLETKAQPQVGASIHNASTCVDRGERSRPYSFETVMSAGGPRRN
jgi:hypothetical protein